MSREKIRKESLDTATQETISMIHHRLIQKGDGTYSSIHEILGIVAEEYDELIDAVRKNNQMECYKELKDIAVGCIIAMACIQQQSLDW